MVLRLPAGRRWVGAFERAAAGDSPQSEKARRLQKFKVFRRLAIPPPNRSTFWRKLMTIVWKKSNIRSSRIASAPERTLGIAVVERRPGDVILTDVGRCCGRRNRSRDARSP